MFCIYSGYFVVKKKHILNVGVNLEIQKIFAISSTKEREREKKLEIIQKVEEFVFIWPSKSKF